MRQNTEKLNAMRQNTEKLNAMRQNTEKLNAMIQNTSKLQAERDKILINLMPIETKYRKTLCIETKYKKKLNAMRQNTEKLYDIIQNAYKLYAERDKIQKNFMPAHKTDQTNNIFLMWGEMQKDIVNKIKTISNYVRHNTEHTIS